MRVEQEVGSGEGARDESPAWVKPVTISSSDLKGARALVSQKRKGWAAKEKWRGKKTDQQTLSQSKGIVRLNRSKEIINNSTRPDSFKVIEIDEENHWFTAQLWRVD